MLKTNFIFLTLTFIFHINIMAYYDFGEERLLFATETTTPSAVTVMNAPAPPSFSHAAGFYGAPFNLTLTAAQGTTIRYTTDGSIPTITSLIYTNPIFIFSPEPTEENSPMSVNGVGRFTDGWINGLPNVVIGGYVPQLYYNGMVIRARAFNGNTGSETVTRSFFVDRDGRGIFNTQVISISTEPDNFAGEQGFYRDWHRPGWPHQSVTDQTRQPVHMEFFDKNGNFLHQQNAEAWVFGNWSRGNPKRSMRFNFNAGDGDIRNLPELIPDTRKNYNIPTESVVNFRHINARTSDNGGSEIRECIVHILSEPLRPTIQNSTYGAVFINGEFWGMYNLRAHRHEHLLSELYGLPRSSIEISDHTWPFHAHINNLAPFTNQNNYEALKDFMCMDEFIDYTIIGYHFDNWDWVNNNYEFWRTTETFPDTYGGDGRWRFIVHDFDNAINDPAANMMAFLTSRDGFDPPVWIEPWGNVGLRDAHSAATFINLFQNEEFRNTFAARYSTYTGTVFHTSRAEAVLNRMVAERMYTIGRDFYRWREHGATTSTDGISRWLNNPWGWGNRSCITGLRTVLTGRVNHSIGHIREYYNRTDRPNLSLNLDTSGFTNIRWQVDSDKGFFDIAGAQIRADLFDRGNLEDYDFCVSDFNADYIRRLPVNVTAKPYEGYEFSHFEVNGEIFSENPINIIPRNEQINVTAFFQKEKQGDYTVLMELTRTEADAVATNNRFNATGGLFANNSHLTAWSGNIQRPIGISGTTRRAPMVFNNFADGWRSVNAAAANHPDFGITADTASAFQIRFETTGHENIRFSARQRSTASGPDFFALAYRVGSEGNFIPIANTKTENRQSPATHQTNSYADFDRAASQSFNQFLLPKEVENQAEVYLRVYMYESEIAADRRVNGNTSINDILIIGDSIDSDRAKLTFSTARAKANETVTINVNIDNNPGFAAMFFRLNIPNGFTLIEAKTNDELENFFSVPAANNTVLGWTGMTHETGNYTENGKILSLTFNVGSVASGFYPLTAVFANAHSLEQPANYNGQPLNITIENGGFHVTDNDCEICLNCRKGDIDGDGRITSRDSTVLAQYLINQSTAICTFAADFYDDGNINSNHLTVLSQLLIGLRTSFF